jgi:2-hydroxy-6-oxonona-2,4-dienedioate hydrolase
VHGSGLSHRYMIPTARELAKHFRVHVPDLPGYGDSGDPGEVLDVPGLADWLVWWMDAVGLERAAFLGNSFGCQVIADLAARYPERATRIVLQGPTTPPGERSGFWQFVRWRQNQPHNPDWGGDDTMEDYQSAGFWRLVGGFISQISDPMEAKMPHIQAPTLIIRGEHDPITHQEWSEELARLVPRGEVVVLPDMAHTLVLTHPGPLSAATREFLERE